MIIFIRHKRGSTNIKKDRPNNGNVATRPYQLASVGDEEEIISQL